MADGWITIGTKLETDKFDKQVRNLETKITKEEQKAQLKIQLKVTQEKELERTKKQLDDLMNKYKQYEKYQKQYLSAQKVMDSGKYKLGSPEYMKAARTELELSSILGQRISGPQPEQFSNFQKIGEQVTLAYMKQEALKDKIKQTEIEYEGINKQVEEYKRNIDQVNIERHNSEVSRLKESFNGVGSAIQNAIHKISRLALGVFGIRSAFMAVRRASSEFASYNPQYAANLEYIRYALTQAIAPVLEYIVGLAKKLLAYIAYIAKAWFGVNIFANASAESFKQAKNNLAGATKQAKELQKTLAGFDEMNIINSTSTGGGGGVSADSFVSPDFDLSNLEDIEIPDWVKWIADNKDIIINAIKDIALAFLIFKTLQIVGIFDAIKGAMGDLVKKFFTWVGQVVSKIGFLRGALLTAGIAAIIIGVYKAIESLIKWMQNPTWENFKGILDGLTTAAMGLGAVLIALNTSNPIGWIILAAAAIGKIVTAIIDANIEENNFITTEQRIKQATDDLAKARENLKDMTDDYVNAVDKAEEAEKKLQDAQKDTGLSIDDLLDKMETEKLTYKDLDDNERKLYKAYVENEKAQKNLTDQTYKMNTEKLNEEDAIYRVMKACGDSMTSYEDYKNKIIETYKEGKISAKDAAKAISTALGNMDKDTREQFTQNLPNEIKQGLDPNQYSSDAQKFKNWWNNGFLNSLGNRIKLQIDAYATGTYSSGNYYDVTRMASGGIINMPNRGVPVGAIAGEAGREGIVPLTDQQAMSELGREIGKNVLINLTNVTTMNGRTILRQMKQLQSEDNFAFNT